MLLDKLSWVHHEGAIYSVHAQPHGTRFATGGFDQKVKVWNLGAALDAEQEAQEGVHKLLAVLSEHTGAVNVVRFSAEGRLLASGSDDAAVILYHMLPGPGGGMLGSSAANVENWRPKLMLRGHATNVADLAWSADSSRLATASMDGNVMVWDAGSGHRIATLSAHSSFVKGVQWDPVGSYLVSQSDDHTVVVHSTSDWALLATIDKPYRRMITDTFATRLSFSPDGAALLTGNSFQRGNHCAVLVPREKWGEPGEFLFLAGHTGAVVSTAFNPRMFHLPREQPNGSAGPSNGKAFHEALTNVFATGDTNRRVVVWTAGSGRPLFAGKALFKAGVTDLSWTSDGYTLLASSGDGTVAVFQFSEAELGKAASSEELEEVMKGAYGTRARDAGGRLLFAESVDQLEEEEQPTQAQHQQQQQREEEAKAAAAPLRQPLADAAGPSNRIVPAPVAAKPAPKSGVAGAKPSKEALAARLEGLMGPGGGETQVGFGAPSGGQAAAAAAAAAIAAAPVRGGDGKKRIVPEATCGGAAGGSMPPPPPRPPVAGAEGLPAAKRQRAEKAPASGRTQPVAAKPSGAAHGGAAAAQAAAAVAQAGAVAVAGWGTPLTVAAPAVLPELTVRFMGEQQLPGEEALGSEPPVARELHIMNRDRGASGRPQAELACLRGQEVLWSDAAAGAVVCACGTSHFAAVGLQDGSLLLYSPAGRRLGGALKLGAGLARLACNGDWLLLCLTTSGRLKLLDVREQRSVLSTTLMPLLEDGSQVLDLRLSRQGWPLLTLSGHRAFVYHPGLEEWMCCVEEAYSGSPYLSTMPLQGQGELAGLQAGAVAGRGVGAGVARRLLAAKPSQQQQSRALLESNLAAALCLRSPQEYRRWLGAYAQLLSEMGDEGRLRELCMELMGPLGPAAAPAAEAAGWGDVAMADDPDVAAAAGGDSAGPPGAAAGAAGWEPRVLGLVKRRELLEGEVLKAMGRSRTVGTLAGEMRDLLEDVRAAGG